MLLKIPIIGGIFRRFGITQFTRSLATLLGGGTPLVPALENAADAIGNRFLSRRVRDVVPRVREGGELWKALEDTGLFTNLTIEMVKVGETSGRARGDALVGLRVLRRGDRRRCSRASSPSSSRSSSSSWEASS